MLGPPGGATCYTVSMRTSARMVFGTAALAFGIVSSFVTTAARALGIADSLAGVALLSSANRPLCVDRARRALRHLLADAASAVSCAPRPPTVVRRRLRAARRPLRCRGGVRGDGTGYGASRAPRAAARIGLGLCSLSFATAQIAYLTLPRASCRRGFRRAGSFGSLATTAAFVLAGGAMFARSADAARPAAAALMLRLFGGAGLGPAPSLARPQRWRLERIRRDRA